MIDVSYIRQKEALGLGHAVLRARNWWARSRSRWCWPTT
jgi:UTP-glucose-1-phosphate uridylyltransferase